MEIFCFISNGSYFMFPISHYKMAHQKCKIRGEVVSREERYVWDLLNFR